MKKVIYTTTVTVTACDADDNGKLPDTERQERTDTWDELHIFADEGKIFRRISTGEVLTAHIGVGTFDDVNDFEEVYAER